MVEKLCVRRCIHRARRWIKAWLLSPPPLSSRQVDMTYKCRMKLRYSKEITSTNDGILEIVINAFRPKKSPKDGVKKLRDSQHSGFVDRDTLGARDHVWIIKFAW